MRVAPGLSDRHISLANVVRNTESRSITFDIVGSTKATPFTSGGEAKIILQEKATTTTPAKTIATLHVHVFARRTVEVDVFFASDTSTNSASAMPNHPSEQDIVNELNEVFGSQANIGFHLHIADNLTVPYAFHSHDLIANQNMNGTLDFSGPAWRNDEPVNKVMTAGDQRDGTKALKIYVVHRVYKISHPSAIGITQATGRDPCFVSANWGIHVYAHEVGHALGLSTKDDLAHNSENHDPGP